MGSVQMAHQLLTGRVLQFARALGGRDASPSLGQRTILRRFWSPGFAAATLALVLSAAPGISGDAAVFRGSPEPGQRRFPPTLCLDCAGCSCFPLLHVGVGTTCVEAAGSQGSILQRRGLSQPAEQQS